MQARRRHSRHCRLVVAALILVTTLLFFTGDAPGVFIDAPTRNLLVPPRRLPLSLGAVREAARPATATPVDAVLLPDWEVLLLLHPNATAIAHNTTCAFRGGASSPARALGRLPSSGRHAYTCAMPEPARRHQPFHAPRIVQPSSAAAMDAVHGSPQGSQMMLKWSGRLVYDSVVVDGGDVLVFAKGVNPRQGVNRPASDVRCVYYRGDSPDDVVASLPAATSAQQVFRCPPPPTTVDQLRVTLAVSCEEEPIPSVATYSPPARGGSSSSPATHKRDKICACTMVRDVGKFLREWVAYHAAVGVDRFILYDNGSEDDLAEQVRRLTAEGLDVSTLAWPWPKTQEAGFSHSAAVHRDACEWMAFIDVDEFIFSPEWATTGSGGSPSSSMLRSIVAVKPDVGQVSLGCMEFGPSGRTAHPAEGVTQGYTCRRRAVERHKSLVRLDAAERSLVNSVHHFALRAGARGEWNRRARVNHYKYQAWEEFRVKFRRRVSAYVADWTNRVNLHSKDRTPGLGFDPVQPPGWPAKFCEVNDTLLRDVTRRWFAAAGDSKLQALR